MSTFRRQRLAVLISVGAALVVQLGVANADTRRLSGFSRARLLAAANTADLVGDVATAAKLYTNILSLPSDPDETTAGSTAIEGLAHLRMMIALTSNGRDDDARDHLAALQQRDPSGPLTRLAAQFWDQYGMTGLVTAACNHLRPQAATQAGPPLETLQALGVDVDSETLCPIPPSGPGAIPWP